MAVPNLGDLVVTTARDYIDNIADNVTANNSLLVRLKSKGQIVKGSGGRSIVEPFIYGTNSSVQFYQDYDTFTPPTTNQTIYDGAEFQWKQLGGFIAYSGKEERMNTGPDAHADIVRVRVKQLQAQLNNTIGASLFSDGTGSAGKELTGLKNLVSDTPTAAGTCGGIDQVANAFWQNKQTTTAAVTSANVQGFMNTMWLSIVRGKDQTDLIIADTIQYSAYWASLQAIQRITQSDVGEAGFPTVRFQNSDVVFDVNCATKHMYFLDSSTIHFRTASDRAVGFTVGDERQIVNADYKVVPVWMMGNLTINRRAGNGLLISA
jgi:hypothetical protein